jgi:hypothetical protein
MQTLSHMIIIYIIHIKSLILLWTDSYILNINYFLFFNQNEQKSLLITFFKSLFGFDREHKKLKLFEFLIMPKMKYF